MRAFSGMFIALALVVLSSMALAAANIVTVVQKGRAFGVAAVELHRGEIIRLSNNDLFLHQAYVETPLFNFESDEQEPGTSVDIRFSKAGLFEVRCHIHPKMLLQVAVR